MKSTTKEGLDIGDNDEKKKLEELKAEFEPLTKLMKEVLGDKAEKVIVSTKLADSICVLTTSESAHCDPSPTFSGQVTYASHSNLKNMVICATAYGCLSLAC